jgi:hypothetical protein
VLSRDKEKVNKGKSKKDLRLSFAFFLFTFSFCLMTTRHSPLTIFVLTSADPACINRGLIQGRGNAMNRSLTLLVVLFANCCGCAAFEDLVLGPDPNLPEFWTAGQATNSCGNAAPNLSASQTQEPELLQAQQ